MRKKKANKKKPDQKNGKSLAIAATILVTAVVVALVLAWLTYYSLKEPPTPTDTGLEPRPAPPVPEMMPLGDEMPVHAPAPSDEIPGAAEPADDAPPPEMQPEQK